MDLSSSKRLAMQILQIPNTAVMVKVYAGKHQRALRKGFQLVLTLARAQPKIEKEK